MHEIYIDYLQYSIQYREQACIERQEKRINGFSFYSHGYEDEIGTRRYFGNKKSNKALVILSGRALHNQRVVGWSERDMINSILAKGANITRLDIAITDYIDDFLLTPKFVRTMFRKGHITGNLTKYDGKVIIGEKVGAPPRVETFYIGDLSGRGKKGIFRAYDKGLEMNLSPDIIARLELEERGENAHNSAKRYASGIHLQQVIQSRLQFNHSAFDSVFDKEPIDLSRGDQVHSTNEREDNEKRWTWLLTQVAPSLRKTIKEDMKLGNNMDNLARFLEISGILK